jgi:diaminohydroxyphosphoribosylaminopyrimidine deaminase/5-amino-6-(5-phosphoribosylamino)uracil reductase
MAGRRLGPPRPQKDRPRSPLDACSWAAVPEMFRTGAFPLPAPWGELFGPLRKGAVDDLVLIGQCGQSIDARIATPSGHSHYINGSAGLDHLHRLRAVVDAVVIGVSTASIDDPQLTVRRVEGPNPARVIIDPNGRLSPNARVLTADSSRRIVVTRADCTTVLPADVERVALRPEKDHISPSAIALALAERGFRRILVEGGAETVSRFLAAHCLDRLHIIVAPIILGSGRSSLTLPPLQHISEATRAPMRVHALDSDVLLDCDLSSHRAPIWRFKSAHHKGAS